MIERISLTSGLMVGGFGRVLLGKRCGVVIVKEIFDGAFFGGGCFVFGGLGRSIEEITGLVDQTIEQPQLGFLGDPRVNVLQLNLQLDRLH